MPTVRKLGIPDVQEIIPTVFKDERGFFSEVFSRDALAQSDIAIDWVQDNQSLSREPYTLRGLHYQEPPFAQDKLVRVLRGRIFDVAVDIRAGSPTYGQWVSLELSADAFNQILVPVGFAHGFVTLEPDTEVIYKVSAPYSAAHDRAIRFDDPVLAIDWPLAGKTPVLSAKDAAAPGFEGLVSPFSYNK